MYQNNSNFNSLEYSEGAVSTRKAYNDSTNGMSNVKRNNFLNMLNQAEKPEASSQPNPPTLRKITLNQRIL